MAGSEAKENKFFLSGNLWAIAVAIGLLTFLVYLPVVYYEFLIYDDPDYITLNPYVLNGITLDGIKWAFTQLNGEKTYWHPITWISHFLDCEIFGANPGAHHLMNVLYHILNSILLFFFLFKLTGSSGKTALVSALFALHPIQVETVAWISERKNLITTLFAILCLLSYLKYVNSSRLRYYLLAILFFAFCLMAKPALTPLPFLMLVLDFYPLRRVQFVFKKDLTPEQINSNIRQVSINKVLLEKIPFLILTVISCVITVKAHIALGGIERSLPLILRIENAIVACAQYIKKAIVPAGFAVVYPHPGLWERETVFASFFLLLVITVYLLIRRRKYPISLVGWLWFLGMLVPVSGIVQAGIQSMALRFLYFPVIGLFMVFVWIIGDWLEGGLFKLPLNKLVSGIVICVCIILTSNQLKYWQNSLTLFEQTLKNTTNNYIAHCNYGLALFYNGNTREAKEHFLDALSIRPRFVEARLNLGMVMEKEGDFSSAAEQYKMAIEIKPDIPFGWKSLARVFNQLNRNDEALKAAKVAEKLNPNDPEVQFISGYLYSINKMPREAIEHYRKSLALNPQQPIVLNNLAYLLSTLPDDSLRNGKEAVALAEKANTLTGGRNIIILGTLAAAYAEAGRFNDAVKTARMAVELANKTNQRELAEKNARLLNLYLQSKPYREEL